jgi:hypothetical protein
VGEYFSGGQKKMGFRESGRSAVRFLKDATSKQTTNNLPIMLNSSPFKQKRRHSLRRGFCHASTSTPHGGARLPSYRLPRIIAW